MVHVYDEATVLHGHSELLVRLVDPAANDNIVCKLDPHRGRPSRQLGQRRAPRPQVRKGMGRSNGDSSK